MIELIIEDKYFEEKPFDGNPDINEEVLKYANNISRWNCPRKKLAGGKTWVDITNANFELSHFHWIVGYLGGEIKGYRGFIKVPTSEMDNVTPDFLPNCVIKNWDESDVENPTALPDTYKTWREWIGKNYSVTEVGEDTYFCTQASGKDLIDMELMQLGSKFTDVIPTLINEE